MKKYHWINDDVKIDFQVDKALKNAMEEAEKLDMAGSVEYGAVADAIDVLCKQSFGAGKMTKEQWDTMCKRYPYA
jgi:hypothetical protein